MYFNVLLILDSQFPFVFVNLLVYVESDGEAMLKWAVEIMLVELEWRGKQICL